MAEGYDRTPLIVDDSSTDVSEQREHGVQQYESYKADNDDGRFVTVGGDVDTEKAGSSVDCGDRTEVVEAESNKMKFGEASNTDSQQSVKLKLIERIRNAVNETRKAAYNSRHTAACCLSTMQNTIYVLNVAKARLIEAIASAEEAEQFDEAARNSALANKYSVAIELANTGMRQIEAAAKSAENCSVNALLRSYRISLDGNEAEVEQQLSIKYCATNSANAAAIVVNKTEYSAIKAVRKSLKDIDPESLEFEGAMSPSEECVTARRSTCDILRICGYNLFSFIIGSRIFASFLTQPKVAENLTVHRTFTVTMGCALVAIPVVYLPYEIGMCFRNKRRMALQKKNRNMVIQIDKRLLKLEEYFESKNISLESVDEEFGCIYSTTKQS